MKWKQSFNALILAVCVAAVQIPSVAATIKWYTDVPQVTAPSATMVVSLQTNASGYGYVLLSTLRDYIGGSPGDQITIIYATTNINNYSWVTNLSTITLNANNAYVNNVVISNLNATNLVLESNAYFYETNFVNYDIVTNLNVQSNAYFYETNFVNYEIVTNLYVTTNIANYSYLTNLYVTNLYVETNIANNSYVTNLNVNRLTVNEITVNSNVTVLGSIFYPTNAWAGPTNVIDCATVDQNYTATGDMAVTGLTSRPTTNAANVLLTILASGANRTIYLTGAFVTGDGARSYVCTNGLPRSFWFRYTPALGGWSNVCDRSFY